MFDRIQAVSVFVDCVPFRALLAGQHLCHEATAAQAVFQQIAGFASEFGPQRLGCYDGCKVVAEK